MWGYGGGGECIVFDLFGLCCLVVGWFCNVIDCFGSCLLVGIIDCVLFFFGYFVCIEGVCFVFGCGEWGWCGYVGQCGIEYYVCVGVQVVIGYFQFEMFGVVLMDLFGDVVCVIFFCVQFDQCGLVEQQC